MRETYEKSLKFEMCVHSKVHNKFSLTLRMPTLLHKHFLCKNKKVDVDELTIFLIWPIKNSRIYRKCRVRRFVGGEEVVTLHFLLRPPLTVLQFLLEDPILPVGVILSSHKLHRGIFFRWVYVPGRNS